MRAPREDYYAVLQVQPNAEPEVIEAAYRQLMRKYHPDSAGSDRERAATLHERAKAINQAYGVLRDSKLRWIYDRSATRQANSAPPPRQPPPTPSASDEARSASDSRGAAARDGTRPANTGANSGGGSGTVAPSPRPNAHVGLMAALFERILTLYYFLPGPYEWESGRGTDFLATLMLPLLGVAGWSLFSGRLGWLVGRGPYIGTFAWALLAMLALPLWSSLPRIALAALPTVLLLAGPVEGLLQQLRVPPLLAWIAAGVLGVVLSARLYLFAVLPTVVVCLTLANAGSEQGGLWSLVTNVGAWVPTGDLALVTLACLIGMLTWLTVLEWRRGSHPAQPKRTTSQATSAQPETPAGRPDKPLFRRISPDRVRTLQTVLLRIERDHGEPPSVILAAKQEANVVLVRESWAYLQTDDGREGWAEWRVAS